MNPLHAAENGDLTQIGLKNNVKTKILSVEPSTWKADDTFTLDYPGMYMNIGPDKQTFWLLNCDYFLVHQLTLSLMNIHAKLHPL